MNLGVVVLASAALLACRLRWLLLESGCRAPLLQHIQRLARERRRLILPGKQREHPAEDGQVLAVHAYPRGTRIPRTDRRRHTHPEPQRPRPESRIVPVPGGRKGVQQVRALEGGPESGRTGQDAGRRPEVLRLHAQPRGPQLPRSGIPQRRRCRGYESGAEGATGSIPTRRSSKPRRKRASPTCPGRRAPGRGAADPPPAPVAVPAGNPGVRPCWPRERAVVREVGETFPKPLMSYKQHR